MILPRPLFFFPADQQHARGRRAQAGVRLEKGVAGRRGGVDRADDRVGFKHGATEEAAGEAEGKETDRGPDQGPEHGAVLQKGEEKSKEGNG